MSTRTQKKIVLAIHGIGDQARNETALATTVRFCDHFNYPGMVSLGAFFGALEGDPLQPALFVPAPPERPQLTGQIGFAEVYWAGIARKREVEGYTLQETKAWAGTLVNRMRVLANRRDPANAGLDYPRIRLVLEEMIETISVLESLLALSRKAGLFDFNLKKVLDAFLGDVQLVTEFAPVRAEIVGAFHQVLAAVEKLYPDARIHLVAHSEGTVVAWLGLLEACNRPALHPWISRVDGFMTIGSPIDKHLALWPELFEAFTENPAARFAPSAKLSPLPKTPGEVFAANLRRLRPRCPHIRWRNYVDYADPVGFNLDTARRWMNERGYQKIFEFTDDDDFSFRRYPVPGKAHVDYWNDAEVFGHFIRTIVEPPAAVEVAGPGKGPPSIWWVPLVTYGISYLVPLLLIHVAVYVLGHSIDTYLHPKDPGDRPGLVGCVLGLSWLLAGASVWLRIVRLTCTWRWCAIGGTIYAGSASAFWWVVHHNAAGGGEVLAWLTQPFAGFGWDPALICLGTSLGMILLFLILYFRPGASPARSR